MSAKVDESLESLAGRHVVLVQNTEEIASSVKLRSVENFEGVENESSVRARRPSNKIHGAVLPILCF